MKASPDLDRLTSTQPSLASAARSVIGNLIDGHAEGTRLARRAMALQEVADGMAQLASKLIDVAASQPADDEAAQRAIAAANAATRAGEDDLDATMEWMLHLERMAEVIRVAHQVALRL